jgi:hypothetical protein
VTHGYQFDCGPANAIGRLLLADNASILPAISTFTALMSPESFSSHYPRDRENLHRRCRNGQPVPA